jgi:excinuclease ABC subunit C
VHCAVMDADGNIIVSHDPEHVVAVAGISDLVVVHTPDATLVADKDQEEAIREVVSRRYREAGEGNELYPEVILIDGGLGQLHAALEAFDQLDVKPPMVISLAKKEELIYMQQRSEPIRLGRENPGLKLVQAMRDEAHRFAQLYHHVLRRKRVLDE